MSPIVSILGQAAVVGALLGTGGALVYTPSDDSNEDMGGRGRIFLTCLVASIALRALFYCFDAGAAMGMLLGGIMGATASRYAYGLVDWNASRLNFVVGSALIGGVVGHLLGQLPAIPYVVVI